MSSISHTTLTTASKLHRIERPTVAWQVTPIIFAIVGGLVPLWMVIAIAAWGRSDFTIALLLSLCIIGLVGLLIALAAMSSKKNRLCGSEVWAPR